MRIDVVFMPSQTRASVRSGTTVLLAAAKAGVRLNQRCAGKAACLTCKVNVADQSTVSAPNQKERFKLGEQLDSGVRLACQTQLLADSIIQVPEDPLKAFIRSQLEGKRQDEDDFC